MKLVFSPGDLLYIPSNVILGKISNIIDEDKMLGDGVLVTKKPITAIFIKKCSGQYITGNIIYYKNNYYYADSSVLYSLEPQILFCCYENDIREEGE